MEKKRGIKEREKIEWLSFHILYLSRILILFASSWQIHSTSV